MLSLDRLNGIVFKGEQLGVEFKSDRLIYALYGLTDEEVTVVEGNK